MGVDAEARNLSTMPSSLTALRTGDRYLYQTLCNLYLLMRTYGNKTAGIVIK